MEHFVEFEHNVLVLKNLDEKDRLIYCILNSLWFRPSRYGESHVHDWRTPVPDISAAEVVRMHNENKERMDRMEERQESHAKLLNDALGLLQRIDERTENIQEAQEKHEAEIDEIKKDINQGKGRATAAIAILSAAETIHASWGWIKEVFGR